jgi:triacylglycerol esterase/lipase EstA (alpha/beta hydrolase family)
MLRAHISVVVACLVVLAGCGSPVTARRVGPRDVYQQDSASVLETGDPSRFTRIVLSRAALDPIYEKSPRIALAGLYGQALREHSKDQILALAEISFLIGQEDEDRAAYLGAAVYAYLYLFGRQETGQDKWDPRTRIAADVYNRALPRAFRSAETGAFEPVAGVRKLPVGDIRIEVPQTSISWPHGVSFDVFLPADEFEVEGLAASYRRPGMGAPLIAERRPAAAGSKDPFPKNLAIPATAFLRVEGSLSDVAAGTATGRLELLDPLTNGTIEVDGEAVPLEAQTTTAYAHLLGESSPLRHEIAAFFGLNTDDDLGGLGMIEPYTPGRIPVILVHGTASSPGRWAGLVNELRNDPQLGDRYQFWFFTYNSGNPIVYSTALLRDSIKRLVERLDPEGADPALREIVLVGHSQGGLLVRLAISDSTVIDYKSLGLNVPEPGDTDVEGVLDLREILIFKPLPEVTRAIFLATPHRGSFMAGGRLGQMGSGMVRVSQRIVQLPWQLFVVPAQALAQGENPFEVEPVGALTAVDNMVPDSRFLTIMAEVPMSKHVPVHSVIGVQGEGFAARGNDGVVAYDSAHLEAAESEVIIRSSHSLQSNPHTVAEVKRILLHHLQAPDGKPFPANATESVAR